MTKAQAASRRARLVKIIHVGRRELNMDEATYRQMLRTAGKADSTTDMEMPALLDVLDHLKKRGFQIRSKAAGARPLTVNPDASKVRALWLFLHALGAVRDPSEAALATYVKRIAKVDDLRWARDDAVTELIETLKKWAMRYLPEAVAKLRAEAVAAHRRQPFTAAQHELCECAAGYLRMGQGFDMHWWAWEALQEALGQVVPVDIQVLGGAEQ